MSCDSYKFSRSGFTSYRSRLSSRLFGGTSMRIVKGNDWTEIYKNGSSYGLFDCVLEEDDFLSFGTSEKQISEFEEVAPVDCSLFWREKLRKVYSREHRLDRKKAFSKAMAYAELDKSRKFLAFYSISFPKGTTDRQAVEIFNICRTRLKRDAGLTSWLRVCERQKNGTIHFHLLTNCWLDIKRVNSAFAVAIKNKLGYQGDYNGVDVEGITDSKKRKRCNDASLRASLVAFYLSKYISKDAAPFSCSPYSCSRDVSRLATSVSVYVNSTASNVVNDFLDLGDAGYGSKTFCSEYATVTTWPRLVDTSTGEVLRTTFWEGVIYNKLIREFNNIVYKCKDCLRALSLLQKKMCLNTETFLGLTGSPIISCDGWDYALSI